MVPPPSYASTTDNESLSSLKVRAEKEAELRQVEEYWKNRVRNLREQVMQMLIAKNKIIQFHVYSPF